jgi:hypothetical protein
MKFLPTCILVLNCLQLARLEVFLNAQCVKVNPDSPQKQVRFLTLSGQLPVVATTSYGCLNMLAPIQAFHTICNFFELMQKKIIRRVTLLPGRLGMCQRTVSLPFSLFMLFLLQMVLIVSSR